MINMSEQDFQNINQIDLECDVIDDDDFIIKDLDNNTFIGEDDREINSKTGVIINLSEDEDTIKTTKSSDNIESNTSVELENDSNIINNFDTIDLETDYIDDTEDDEEIISKELVDEELIAEYKKHKKDNEKISSNYWDEIAKKHRKSNKKGSYNTHFHLGGNPEDDMKFFNHVMNTDSQSLLDMSANSDTQSDFSSSESADIGVADAGAGYSESLTEDNCQKTFSDQFNKFLSVLGFEALKNSNNSFTVLDLTNPENDFECKDLSDMLTYLEPYIYDCIIIPLQVKTNQTFNTCKDWNDWYKSLNQKDLESYIDSIDELKFCDLITNHLDECLF